MEQLKLRVLLPEEEGRRLGARGCNDSIDSRVARAYVLERSVLRDDEKLVIAQLFSATSHGRRTVAARLLKKDSDSISALAMVRHEQERTPGAVLCLLWS